MTCVTVSSGLIVHGNMVLIGKKPNGSHPAGLGGKWVLPGGRVEAGESVSDALLREVLEETGLRVHIDEMMGEHLDIRSHGSTRIIYFRCKPITLDAIAGDDLEILQWVDSGCVLKCFDTHVSEMFSPKLLSWFHEHTDEPVSPNHA